MAPLIPIGLGIAFIWLLSKAGSTPDDQKGKGYIPYESKSLDKAFSALEVGSAGETALTMGEEYRVSLVNLDNPKHGTVDETSDVVVQAKLVGINEPDPGKDLSGKFMVVEIVSKTALGDDVKLGDTFTAFPGQVAMMKM